jgi:DNA-binding response OmpR family regulator
MPPPPKTPLRCLVADDEPQIGDLLREALAPAGYAADVVQDGEAAARKLAEEPYALLVSDVMMPHKTGVELVRELRGRGQGIPIVLMSSFLSDETVRTCGKLRHVAFLQKPFSLTDLRRAIHRAIDPASRTP